MYETFLDVMRDPLFAPADLELRKGRHISVDNDAFTYDFLTSAHQLLEEFYAAYGLKLALGQEGYFYLLPDRNLSPAPLGSKKLGSMDMLVGQALALMRLDPAWLKTAGYIPDLKILELLDHIVGQERLLVYVGRKRSRDNELEAKKLRDLLGASLKTLERMGFLRREGRGEASAVLPLLSIMRFTDPVRTSDCLGKAMERLIAEGEIEEINDEAADPVDPVDSAEAADPTQVAETEATEITEACLFQEVKK